MRSEPHLTVRGRALLYEVASHLEQYPEEFHMESWIFGSTVPKPELPAGQAELCATTCCIAGWVVLLDNKVNRPADLPPLVVQVSQWSGLMSHADAERALKDALHLPYESISTAAARTLFADYSVGQQLFHVESWPHSFRTRYEAMGNDLYVSKARLAAEYIRLYADTDGQLGQRLSEEEMYGSGEDLDDEEPGAFDDEDEEFDDSFDGHEPEEDGDDKDDDE